MWNRREISVSSSHNLPTDGCGGAAGRSDHPAVAMAVMRALRRDGASEHGGGSTPCACAGCAWCWRWGRHTVVVAVAVVAVAVMMMVVVVVVVMMMMMLVLVMVLVMGRPLVWAEAWWVMAVAGGAVGTQICTRRRCRTACAMPPTRWRGGCSSSPMVRRPFVRPL
eukprot:COSAG01_NODE_1543_length_9973_cov_3.152015_2_plen_166_part_00